MWVALLVAFAVGWFVGNVMGRAWLFQIRESERELWTAGGEAKAYTVAATLVLEDHPLHRFAAEKRTEWEMLVAKREGRR